MKANWIHPKLRSRPKDLIYPPCSADRQARYWRDNPNTTYKCTRKAIVQINGKDYCYQHGGAIALENLVNAK